MTMEARYAVPLLSLSAVAAGFLLLRRFRPGCFVPIRGKMDAAVRAVAVLPLVASGTLHLVRPQVFLSLLPPPLPRQAWVIVLTGLPELAGAAGLLVPGTRRAASVCLAIFMVAIFPANVYVAGQTIGGLPMPTVPVRTAMQAAYILLLLCVGWGVPVRGTQSAQHP